MIVNDRNSARQGLSPLFPEYSAILNLTEADRSGGGSIDLSSLLTGGGRCDDCIVDGQVCGYTFFTLFIVANDCPNGKLSPVKAWGHAWLSGDVFDS